MNSPDASYTPIPLPDYVERPHAEMLARDVSCFDVAQRTLVTRLLKERRLQVAVAAAADLLLVHAGLTTDDLAWLQMTNRDAFASHPR